MGRKGREKMQREFNEQMLQNGRLLITMNAPQQNIWIVSNTTWYVFNFRSRLISELTQRGYSVTVLSPADDYVARIQSLGSRHLHLEMDNAGTNPVRDLLMIARLMALFKRERPALLLTYTPKVNIYCAVAAKWTNVPVVSNISGLGTGFIRGGWLSLLVRALYRLALTHPKKVFFQNEDDHRLFIDYGLVAAGKTERLPGSGVDVNRFRPVERSLPGRHFIFLMVARLLRDKGVSEYVEAARQLREKHPAVRFHLLGFLDARNPTAISREQVQEWERAGLVCYLGAADDVTPYYADADCVVLPSYREGCPRSLLEAASMAKAIITTDVPGCRQVVDDGVTGLLVKVRDALDLAGKMERMLSYTEDERRAMGHRGREKMIREFDEKIVIDRYLQVIDETVGCR